MVTFTVLHRWPQAVRSPPGKKSQLHSPSNRHQLSHQLNLRHFVTVLKSDRPILNPIITNVILPNLLFRARSIVSMFVINFNFHPIFIFFYFLSSIIIVLFYFCLFIIRFFRAVQELGGGVVLSTLLLSFLSVTRAILALLCFLFLIE